MSDNQSSAPTTAPTTADIVTALRGERVLMLTVTGEDGRLFSHPMTPQRVDDDATVYFFVSSATDLGTWLRANPQVNLASASKGAWLSVAGEASFLEGAQMRNFIEEHWDGSVESFFDGKDDPNLEVLKVDGSSAQFWGTPGGIVPAVVELVKAKITGEKPAGHSGTTEL